MNNNMIYIDKICWINIIVYSRQPNVLRGLCDIFMYMLMGLILMCRMLQGHKVVDSNNDGGPQFAEVFVVVWVGSAVITVNSKLLGGTM